MWGEDGEDPVCLSLFRQGTPPADGQRSLDLLLLPRPAAPSAPAVSKHCQGHTGFHSCPGGTWIPLLRIFAISYNVMCCQYFFFQQSLQEWGNGKFSIISIMATPEEKFTEEKWGTLCADHLLPARFQSCQIFILSMKTITKRMRVK